MKQRIIIFLLISAFSIPAQSQMAEGMITYNRKTDWISIMAKLPYLSSEEVDRMRLTWGNNDDDKGDNYELYIKDNKSLYTYKEEEQSESGWSWKKGEFILIRDYKDKKVKDIRDEFGAQFLIEDDMPKTKWKILNEIKEIEGYLCMKAETKDTIKGQTIHAWFTDGIPFMGGPEGFGGLPGMILELDINDGDAIVTATSIDLKSPIDKLPVPKKMKGKKVDYTKLNKMREDFIAESVEGQKNPFWRMRY